MRSLASLQAPPQLAALRPLNAAIANRDVAPAEIVWWGDSVTEGSTLTDDKHVASYRFQEMLRGAFPTLGVLGGRGYVPAYYESASLPATCTQDSSQAVVGTPLYAKLSSAGLGARGTQLTYGGAIIFTGDCTSFDIHYTKLEFGCAFEVYVDGVVVTPGGGINTSKGSSGVTGGFIWSSPELSPGEHVVRVRQIPIGGGFEGFIACINGITWFYGDRSKGIHVYNAGKSGAAAAGNFFSTEHYRSLTTIVPAAVVVQLVTNDAVFYSSPATFKTDLQTNLSLIHTAMGSNPYTLIGMTVPQPTGTFIGGALWPEYIRSMKEALDGYANSIFVDMSDFMGPNVGSDLLGLWNDGVHASRKGHSLWADRLLWALNLNGGGTTLPVSAAYQSLPYFATGNLTVRTGKSFIYNDTGAVWTFAAGRAEVATAPTGAGIIVAVKVNGSTAFNITIPSGSTTSGLVSPTTYQVPIGGKVSLDITQVGSTTPGADLSVTLTTQSIV